MYPIYKFLLEVETACYRSSYEIFQQVMGPEDIKMSSLSINSNSNSANLAVPKLHDDGSNWSDYEPRIHKAMGSKGLWRHIEGTAVAPRPYMLLNGIPVLKLFRS